MSNPLRLTRARRDSPWLSPAEAADYLGVSVDSVYEAVARKGLKHSKLGHSTIRLRRDWIDAWADARARVNDAEPPKSR